MIIRKAKTSDLKNLEILAQKVYLETFGTDMSAVDLALALDQRSEVDEPVLLNIFFKNITF